MFVLLMLPGCIHTPHPLDETTGISAYLILALDVALLRSVAEVPAELFDKRLPARIRGSGLRTKNTRLGPRRGVAQER